MMTESSEPTSMPNSMAEVADDTANTPVAEAALDFAALGGKVAASIAANHFGLARELGVGLLKISENQLGVQAGIGEDHGLQIVLQEFLSDAGRFVDVAAADAERAIHDRRVIKDECLFRSRRAVRGLHFHIIFNEV